MAKKINRGQVNFFRVMALIGVVVIILVVKEFLNAELYKQRTLLIQLLLKNDNPEFQYLSYLLYDLLSNENNGSIDTQEQTLLFDTLPWSIKKFFKNAMKNTIDYTKKISNFDKALHSVLLNLAKRVVNDGEGASKFITINVTKAKTDNDAKKIAFSIANSPLVKTAIAGNDPNWGRIIMAIGKAGIDINIKKLSIKLGHIKIIEKGQLFKSYIEDDEAVYMRESKKIDITVEMNVGKKFFTAYTMDFTKKYIEINADYRT